jgi:hypothetical protein
LHQQKTKTGRDMKKIMILALTMASCLSATAQSQLSDIQMNDSIMRKIDMQFGYKQQWKHMLKTDNSQQSVVICRSEKRMAINTNMLKMKAPVLTSAYQPVFTRKDEQMWAKDYTAWTFLSDIIIGR